MSDPPALGPSLYSAQGCVPELSSTVHSPARGLKTTDPMKEISPADESGRGPGLLQTQPGPGPAAHSGQGQVRAATSREDQRRCLPTQGSGVSTGPGC